MNSLSPFAVRDQPLAGLARRLPGAGDAGGDVDRDDFAAFVKQGFVDLEEVPDRRLGGRRATFRGSQALVEARVVVYLGLALLVAVDGNVEADPLDPT